MNSLNRFADPVYCVVRFIIGLTYACHGGQKLFGFPGGGHGTSGLYLTAGIIELVCIALYVIPRTSVFGAILLTGYLGGAIATQVRVDAPLFSTTLFPIYVALFLWGGLYFRDDRVRSLIPLRR